MGVSIEFQDGPLAGFHATLPSPAPVVAMPVDERLRLSKAAPPFAFAVYRRDGNEDCASYRFLHFQRPGNQPFPVEFVGGPAEGVGPLTQPIEYGPTEMAVPLGADMRPLLGDDELHAIAIYVRRNDGGGLKYHFLRTETQGQTLDRMQLEMNDERLRQAVNRFYQCPNNSIYTMQPTGEHKQVYIEHGHRHADVDEQMAPLIRELWRLELDTSGSCQDRPAGESHAGDAYVAFPFASHGRRFEEILSEVGIASASKTAKLTISQKPSSGGNAARTLGFDALNVFFAPKEIERIAVHLRRVRT